MTRSELIAELLKTVNPNISDHDYILEMKKLRSYVDDIIETVITETALHKNGTN